MHNHYFPRGITMCLVAMLGLQSVTMRSVDKQLSFKDKAIFGAMGIAIVAPWIMHTPKLVNYYRTKREQITSSDKIFEDTFQRIQAGHEQLIDRMNQQCPLDCAEYISKLVLDKNSLLEKMNVARQKHYNKTARALFENTPKSFSPAEQILFSGCFSGSCMFGGYLGRAGVKPVPAYIGLSLAAVLSCVLWAELNVQQERLLQSLET